MAENDNPYRAPQTPGRRAARAWAARRWWWWAYSAGHFIAFVLTMQFSSWYIQGAKHILETSPIKEAGLAVALSLPVAGLVDIYLWLRSRASKFYARLALSDSLITALQIYVLLLPAVSP